MLEKDYRDVPAQPVSEGITIRWVIDESDGAPNFAMRVIEFQPGAVFERHHHPYEHEIFVLEGEGQVENPERTLPMTPGASIFVPANEPHGYRNTGDEALRFICIIPNQE